MAIDGQIKADQMDRVSLSTAASQRKSQMKIIRLMGGKEKNDEREFSRRPKHLIVDYADDISAFRDFTKDISAGGMFIETHRLFKIGQNLTLTFSMEESELPIKVDGTVVRKSPIGIGVKFNWLSDSAV